MEKLVMIISRCKYFLIFMTATILASCSGDKTFNDYARAGDTIAIATGWKKNFHRENITVTITPSFGPDIVIPPDDPAIRASINFYPDPLSSAIISRETGTNQTIFAKTYAQTLSANFTNGDKDWYQTTVFIDLPVNLPIGLTQIMVSNTEGADATSKVEIIEGVGTPSTFTAEFSTDLTRYHLDSFSRVEHYIISFSGNEIPHAIELLLTHDPDATVGGSGDTFAVNPLGYKKNLFWTDDGTSMKVILTPTKIDIIDNLLDYKFYIAGGVTNVNVLSVTAYNNNGEEITNFFATSTPGH